MSPPAAGLLRAPGADSAALLTHWIMTARPPAPRRRRQRASSSRRPSPGPVRRIRPAGAVTPRPPRVDYWLPLHSWSAADVWADIAASGVPYHKVYDLGMPRLSCILCPLASEAALVLSAQLNPAAAAVRAAMEREFVRRKAVVTFAAGLALYQLGGFAPGPMRLIRLAARPGALFKKNLPMAEIVALARTRPRPAVVDDWAA